MKSDVQQAREIGELTATVKSTNTILERMEDKLDGAILTVGNHSQTIAMLARVSSENSGAIVQIQETVFGKDRQNGMAKDVAELKQFKCNKEKFEEENRVGVKKIMFAVSERLALLVVGGMFAGGVLKKLFEYIVK